MSRRAKPTRRCSRCGETKPVAEFAWRHRDRGLRDNYCRACRAEYKRQHYAANRERYLASSARKRLTQANERVSQLLGFFQTHPCVDCGEADPVVLEFDHPGELRFDVTTGIGRRNWEAMFDEIAKCDVVCANCHRRRTALRAGLARAAVAQR